MNEIIKIMLIIVVIIVGIIFVYGLTLSIMSNEICKKVCLGRGTFAYDIYPSGNFRIDDICVCYFEGNKIESFKLGT